MARPSLTVEQFFKEHAASLQMRLVAGNSGMGRIIREPTVNRPGLALSGFTRYFAYKRVQVFGNAEVYYLRSLKPAERARRYAHFFTFRIPCIVFSRSFRPDKEFMPAAEKAVIRDVISSIRGLKNSRSGPVAMAARRSDSSASPLQPDTSTLAQGAAPAAGAGAGRGVRDHSPERPAARLHRDDALRRSGLEQRARLGDCGRS